MDEIRAEKQIRHVYTQDEPVIITPDGRSAAFALHMANSLAFALTSRNQQVEGEIAKSKQIAIITALSESFARAQGLDDLKTVIAQLQKTYGKAQFPLVAEWLDIQGKTVDGLIDSCKGAYNEYQAQLAKFNDYVNAQWGELYRHSNFATAFTYNQFVTYMSGKGDPVCNVPGSKYYGHTISYELKPLPGRIGDAKGLWFNWNYHPNRKKTTGMFDHASQYYDIWKGEMATNLHSFSTKMTQVHNQTNHELIGMRNRETQTLHMMNNMSTILDNLAFDSANLPGEM